MYKNCKTCLMCGNPSGNCKFCRSCREMIHKSGAIVSQNVTKLKELLKIRRRTMQWFERFNTYARNINQYGKILCDFKASDSLRSYLVTSLS